MIFEPMNFENLNETDVREEILAPLIRLLGYRSGSEHNVIREQSLRYPRLFLGRKDSKKDPHLRGKADYILEAGGKVRWVIEAKAPDSEINIDEIEQAWTYASHPEIRAVYFILSNGRELQIFQTNQGPSVGSILSLTYEQLNSPTDYRTIENILSPASILRDHPEYQIDTGIPLGPGLRSFARVTNGLVRYENNSLGLAVLNELQTSISEGALERDEENRMVAFMKTIGPSRSLQELNERLGLTSFEMTSDNRELSTDLKQPTIFYYENTVRFPAGEQLLDLNSWKHITLASNLTCNVKAKAIGTLIDHTFSGVFMTNMSYLEARINIEMTGSFYIHLI